MLTVILSTYNRGHLLAKTLDSFSQLEPPKNGWKLIVIDNRSHDDTRKVVLSFQDQLPLTYIYESKPGKSAALNRGLSDREGDLIILTDDDVLAHKDWLLNLEAAADANPGYHLFGGRIIPRWEIEPEAWLTETVSIQGNFALTDPSWLDGPIKASLIFGPNMACRSEVFDKGFLFDERIATDGTTSFPMGDETDLLVRAERAGFKAWFVKDAVIEHTIPASNIKPKWLIRRAFRQGRGWVCVFQQTGIENAPILFGCPRFLWRSLAEDGLAVLHAYLLLNKRKILKARCALNYRCGQIYQHRVFSRNPK